MFINLQVVVGKHHADNVVGNQIVLRVFLILQDNILEMDQRGEHIIHFPLKICPVRIVRQSKMEMPEETIHIAKLCQLRLKRSPLLLRLCESLLHTFHKVHIIRL